MEGPSIRMHELISQPAKILELFGGNKGKSEGNGAAKASLLEVPREGRRLQHAVKNIMFQLTTALMHYSKKGMAVRDLSWMEIVFTPEEVPVRLRLSNALVRLSVKFADMLFVLQSDFGSNWRFAARADINLKMGWRPMAPEYNRRVLAPYFMNQELADMIVECRNKTGMRKEANKALEHKAAEGHEPGDEEELSEEVKAATRFEPQDPFLWKNGPPTFNAPDVWNLGVMLMQLLAGSNKGTKELILLNDINKLYGCEQNGRYTPPFERNFEKAKADETKYLQMVSYFMFETPTFSPGPPDKNDQGAVAFDWETLAKDKTYQDFVPMLKRMLDCDYRSRATVNEVMRMVMELHGGEVAPPDSVPPPLMRPGHTLSYEYAIALGMDPDTAAAMVANAKLERAKVTQDRKEEKKTGKRRPGINAGKRQTKGKGKVKRGGGIASLSKSLQMMETMKSGMGGGVGKRGKGKKTSASLGGGQQQVAVGG